jgi:hypothetical protein
MTQFLPHSQKCPGGHLGSLSPLHNVHCSEEIMQNLLFTFYVNLEKMYWAKKV